MADSRVLPEFVPGIELARGFYEDVLAPVLSDTSHAAARLGWGSDVLGFDDERSTDHGWGPRAQVFVRSEHVPAVEARIAASLPESYRGWPVRFGWDAVPVQHHRTALRPLLEVARERIPPPRGRRDPRGAVALSARRR